MLMKKFYCLILLLFCTMNTSFSQGKFIVQNKRGSDKIKFKLINNLIVIPVEINGVELSFLLDTGVTKPIIFNFLNITDALQVKNTENIFLRGLGEGEAVQALKSSNNIFKIGDAININQDLFAVYDVKLNLAPRLGIPVHGIIGFDLFKDLVVEINYFKQFIRLVNQESYNYKDCSKCETLNLEFYNNKPYINASVTINNKDIPVKLLIDSGGSDALWIFEDESLGLVLDDKYFEDFLGHGLSGSVYGRRSKVKKLSIKSFELKNANVAYPDSSSIVLARQFKNRNGSLAGNVLKRFNLIFDYQKAKVSFRKNNFFKNEFSYNRSGIELEHDGIRLAREKDYDFVTDKIHTGDDEQQSRTKIIINTKYKLSLKPAYSIVELRKDSPAEQAGLLLGDVILSVNNKSADSYSMHEIINMFYGEDGKRIKLKVDRNGQVLDFQFYLKSLF